MTNPTTDDVLKPCPLCGGRATYLKPYWSGGCRCGDYVSCTKCSCRNFAPNKVGAPSSITAWNTRPTATNGSDAVIATLRDALEAVVRSSYVGAPGKAVRHSKWMHYPADIYHKMQAALANREEAGK